MTLPEDAPDDQPADGESRPDEVLSEVDEASESNEAEETSEVDETPSQTETPRQTDETPRDAPVPDPSTVQVDTGPLDRARAAIDEAREAVKKVARTDSIDDEATGAGELPAFADSVAGVEKPKAPEDDPEH